MKTKEIRCIMCNRKANWINRKTNEYLCSRCAQNNEEARRKK